MVIPALSDDWVRHPKQPSSLLGQATKLKLTNSLLAAPPEKLRHLFADAADPGTLAGSASPFARFPHPLSGILAYYTAGREAD